MKDHSRWCIPWVMLKPFWTNRATIGLDDLESMGALKWQKKESQHPNYDWLTPLLQWIKENEVIDA